MVFVVGDFGRRCMFLNSSIGDELFYCNSHVICSYEASLYAVSTDCVMLACNDTGLCNFKVVVLWLTHNLGEFCGVSSVILMTFCVSGFLLRATKQGLTPK